MDRLVVEVEIVTPAYLGGAGQQPEVREASFRGLLRHWYRALDSDYAKNEAKVFGDAGDVGRSPVTLRVLNRSTEPRTCYLLARPPGPVSDPCFRSELLGLRYLAFPFGMKGGQRNALAAGQRFRIEHTVRFPGKGLPGDEASMKRAIVGSWWALSSFGGIGSRCRRGLGSLSVTGFEADWEEAKVILSLSKRENPDSWWSFLLRTEGIVRSWFAGEHKNDHVVISKDTRFALIGAAGQDQDGFSSWERALDYVGQRLQTFRSGLKPEEKAAFGLPVESKKLTVKGEKSTRGASPLHLSVKSIGTKYYVLVTLTPSPVLPVREQIRVMDHGESYRTKIATGILDRFYSEIAGDTKWRTSM